MNDKNEILSLASRIESILNESTSDSNALASVKIAKILFLNHDNTELRTIVNRKFFGRDVSEALVEGLHHRPQFCPRLLLSKHRKHLQLRHR
jgi:hypothetical protein